ncbi:MAG TPA: rod shape-determining protein RodA [Thiothrix sp.]|nr:rod shape-determining protein RodA [Thiothrix sp.]
MEIFTSILRWFSRLDIVLLSAMVLLLFLGGITLYSASNENYDMVYRQGIHLLISATFMLIFAQIKSKTLQQWAVWVYGFGIVLLILVLAQGHIGKGAERWLDLGVFRFQPSEIMKLAVPIMVARYFVDRPLPPNFKDIAVSLFLIAVPMVLIMKQPDLGTSLLVGSAGFFVIYFAGLSWRLILIALSLGIAGAFAGFHYLMHDYQRQRVLTLFNPDADRLNSGYHIIQSKIAIGSGGVYGKGWLHGDQSRLDFLPERHTDFIFAVFGEEFGLLGNIILLSIYLFIIWRGLFLATRGQDTFARLLAGSLSLTFFVYLFVNTGMVSGILPVVGVPLPLVSYGGTSMVTLMAAFGILMGMKQKKRGYGYQHSDSS